LRQGVLHIREQEGIGRLSLSRIGVSTEQRVERLGSELLVWGRIEDRGWSDY
jgi:hypothetical protein